MAVDWKTGTPSELLRDLRVAGWVQGQSGLWPTFIRLHKTDLISDIKTMEPGRVLLWRIGGDPDATGRYAHNRRRVIVWLGK